MQPLEEEGSAGRNYKREGCTCIGLQSVWRPLQGRKGMVSMPGQELVAFQNIALTIDYKGQAAILAGCLLVRPYL